MATTCFQLASPLPVSKPASLPSPTGRPAFPARSRMSVSPKPSLRSRTTSAPSARTRPSSAPSTSPFVTELTHARDLDERLAALGDRSFMSVSERGAVRERPVLVIVEAYSKSCRACIGVKRVYEKVAEQHKDSVHCFRFDAFECGSLAQTLGVRGMPTFVLFKAKDSVGEGGETVTEWRRIDHFSTAKRAVIEQTIIDNL